MKNHPKADNKPCLKFDKGEAKLLEEGIIENVIYDYASLECEDVLKFRELNQTLAQNSQSYLVLVEPGLFSSISFAARKLVASAEFKQLAVAKALLAKNFAQELVVNFYLRVNRPVIETRIFTKRSAALQWLRKKKQELQKH